MSYLSYDEQRYYEQRKASLERALEGLRNSPFHMERSVGLPQVRKELMKVNKILEAKCPPTVRGKTKDKLKKRAEELAQFIKDGMPTRDEMMGKRVKVEGGLYGDRAQVAREEDVRKHLRWQSEKQKAIVEYQKTMRTLDPNDPDAGDVEKLRP